MIGGLLKSASRVALFAAAGLFVGGVAMPSAKAADLGGDCCADLEERVAELEATTARKGNRRVSLTVSGQVNTAVMYWNDGLNSDTYIVDNAVSRSGFQFDGTAKINPNLTAGFQMVIGLAAGARSHQLSQDDDDGHLTAASGAAVGFAGGDGVINVELANWFLRHDTLGEIRVGRINMASAGSTQVDLGGAGVIANVNVGLWARSFFLTFDGAQLTGTWSTALGGGTVNVSGLNRANAISYTTPTVAGFSASAAWGEDSIWDAALKYAGEFSGFRVAAAVAYTSNTSGVNEVTKDGAIGPEPTKLQGSASVMHVASGLYLTGAYVNLDSDVAGRPDTTLWYVQGGVSKNWTGLGNTVLYGEYTQVNDGIICAAGTCQAFGGNAGDTVTSSQANVWGLGIVQHIDAAAMELYLSYRHFEAEVTSGAGNLLDGTETIGDFDVIMAGARIRF